MNKTIKALKLSLDALENAESVAASINAGKRHAIQVEEETCFWQREEWVRWAIDEVLPEIRQALAAIREALADPVKQEPVLRVGDSSFEEWYQAHPKACGGDKQLARDAYAAGMGDPLVAPVGG